MYAHRIRRLIGLSSTRRNRAPCGVAGLEGEDREREGTAGGGARGSGHDDALAKQSDPSFAGSISVSDVLDTFRGLCMTGK